MRLLQGDYDRETAYSDDPVAVARQWADLGAPRIHVVDLDGAKDGVGKIKTRFTSFGSVVEMWALYRSALQEFWRVLRPEGIAVTAAFAVA